MEDSIEKRRGKEIEEWGGEISETRDWTRKEEGRFKGKRGWRKEGIRGGEKICG